MLQIGHRESHDIDIFLPDPQLLPFLDPQKRDFKFDIRPDDYGGDGARSLKLTFGEIGEIDFIVASALTSSPTIRTIIEGQPVLLETIAEIVAKKVVYRGARIRPRDIFDIAAAGERHSNLLATELRSYREEVTQTLASIDKLNVKFVSDTIAELTIREPYKGVAEIALERSKEILRAV